ncbi:MAG: hypothetical protein JKY52_10065 [Flavobacteriales bacterium]|nr:hypothetical protein [Flavobacteriales bacterium]
MVLTRAEFCSFNIPSRLQLLQKDGEFLADRWVCPSQLINLYHIYTFYVEVITDLMDDRVINADPIINPDILALYKAEVR